LENHRNTTAVHLRYDSGELDLLRRVTENPRWADPILTARSWSNGGHSLLFQSGIFKSGPPRFLLILRS
jgi:hypothetical protein